MTKDKTTIFITGFAGDPVNIRRVMEQDACVVVLPIGCKVTVVNGTFEIVETDKEIHIHMEKEVCFPMATAVVACDCSKGVK